MADQFEGVGGSYVLNKDGLREKVEGTADKLASASEVEVVESSVKPAYIPPAVDKED